MSLLTICTKALRGLSGFPIPSTFYGNNDGTAVLAVALANESGQDLEKECRWQQLVTEHTFSTVADTATYDLPSDFRAFANMTQWDRSNQWRMTGPISPMIYQYLKSGFTVVSNTQRWFLLRGNKFTIYPTPSVADETIAFDYYSKAWITKQMDSSFISEWSGDNDTARLDEDLIAADLKWRFLEAKGMPFEPEYRRYETIKDVLQADNGGRGVINLGCSPVGRGEFPGNLPETGYGS